MSNHSIQSMVARHTAMPAWFRAGLRIWLAGDILRCNSHNDVALLVHVLELDRVSNTCIVQSIMTHMQIEKATHNGHLHNNVQKQKVTFN